MGKLELMKENFEPPPGWKWDSDWYINPELRFASCYSMLLLT
jgi:hypothetical protein